MTSDPTAQDILAELAALSDRSTAGVRHWRRLQSRRLASWPGPDVLTAAQAVFASPDPLGRFVAYELITHHRGALDGLTHRAIRCLGRGLASWGDTDMFACYVAGPAWRRGRLRDADILAWTRSRDRLWRRAALVATVPLNVRAQGGTGEPQRTLRVCQALITDRDPMVVKALSWALRALAPWDPQGVRRFLTLNEATLAPRVRREVSCKLATGRKTPRRA